MNRQDNFRLLSKLNILKGYLVEDHIDKTEILNIANSLFEKDYIKDLIENVNKEHFTDALNLLNHYILDISNLIFKNPCNKSWYDLISTDENSTKFCLDCSKNVYLVSNEEEFLNRRNLNQCVALNTHDFKPDDKIERNFKSCRIKFYDEPLLGDPF